MTAVTTQLTSTPASAVALTFKVPVAGSVSETQITYTIKNVKKAATDTVNQVTKTVTAPVSGGYATIDTSPDTYFATGLVEISATVGESTKFTPTIVCNNADFTVGFAATPNDLTVGTAGTLKNLTITAPTGTKTFDYSITVEGVKETIAAVTADDASNATTVTVSAAPFDTTTTVTATGAVTIKVTISDVKREATLGGTTVTGVTISSNAVSYGGATKDDGGADAKIALGADGTVKSDLVLTVTAVGATGTAEILRVNGASLVGTYKVDVTDRTATTITFEDVQIEDVTENVSFLIVFTPNTARTISWASALDTPASLNGSTDNYSITALTASGANISTPKSAYKGETVKVTVSGAAAGGSFADNGTITVKANGTTVGTKDAAAGAMDFEFTMPDENVTITVEYAAPVVP